jgi:Mg-chelatase subunit ChlD
MYRNAQATYRTDGARHRTTRQSVQAVYGSDRISLIGFEDRGRVIQSLARVHDANLQANVLELHNRVAGSSTNIADGLRLGVEVLARTRPGILRRAWVLTDGYPNRDNEHIYAWVDQARQAHININTIGFGDSYDEALLRRISASTHNGRFVSVRNLRQLTDALGVRPGQPRHHRAEHTAYVIDLSGSMVLGHMEGRPKIQVVQDAMIQLLNYKMKCFA